jgi:hypothetical protein
MRDQKGHCHSERSEESKEAGIAMLLNFKYYSANAYGADVHGADVERTDHTNTLDSSLRSE